MELYLRNSLSQRKEKFRPLRKKSAGLYTCGPTVYQYAHIGNLRTYIFEDILKRILKLAGFRVRHVMNITDVGHLTSDEDSGEDKVAKEAARQRKTAWQIARFYERAFKADLKKLNISEPDVWARATEHIPDQISLIKVLERRGFTYIIDDGVYFDTGRFSEYGALLRSKPQDLEVGERILAKDKRNPADFALWKFTPKGQRRDMEWSSPWGTGFPGWHVECSAMAMKYLGRRFDIHAGGIDHIPIHHTNEIAQSEAATGQKFVNYWLHGNFLQVDGKRMGKSEGNFLTLSELENRGFSALDFRYFTFSAHYRSPLLFSLDALESARNARRNIENIFRRAMQVRPRVNKAISNGFKKEFTAALYDDLDLPRALAVLWKHSEKIGPLDFIWADRIFCIGLAKIKPIKVSAEMKKLLKARERFRLEKNWAMADQVRKKINQHGFQIEDTQTGPVMIPIS